MSSQAEIRPRRSLIPPNKWNDYYVWPPIGGLRYLIFNAETNGFDEHEVIKRRGRNVLIDEEKFFEWLDDQQQNSAS